MSGCTGHCVYCCDCLACAMARDMAVHTAIIRTRERHKLPRWRRLLTALLDRFDLVSVRPPRRFL